MLVVIPDLDVTYVRVKLEDVEEIVESHIKEGKPVERLLYVDPKTQEHVFKNEEINFYAKQTRTTLANCGEINAESLDEALAVGAYEALHKVLEKVIRIGLLKKLQNQDCAAEAAAVSLQV